MQKNAKKTDYTNIEIALTLSGGGYRASIFHIGVLSYLYHLKLSDGSRLLDHITVMSTVSGGTITGMLYLLSPMEENELPQYLGDMYKKIIDNNLANYLLSNIKKKRNSSKLSVIKELGNVYDSVFFNGKKLGALYNVIQNCHIHHYAAYATDISNALPFRFQVANSIYGDSTIGNEAKGIDVTKAKEFRLADILAASSCFPIAFEPINFPRDFKNYPENDELAQSDMQTLLMDGGIIDNQGIDYLLEANKHMEAVNKAGIDLAIISDAASSLGERTTNVETLHNGKWGLFINKLSKIKQWFIKKLKTVTVIRLQLFYLIFGIIFCVVGLFANLKCWVANIFWGLFIASILIFLLICAFRWYTPRKLKKNDQFNIPKNLIWKVDFNQYGRVISKRYQSFSKVVSTVMMGHIRKKNIELLSMDSRWTNRFVIPCISSLTSNGSWKEDEMAKKIMVEASSIMGISDVASNFHSTLWFSKDDINNDIPKKILACGQFTICYELYMWVKSHDGRKTNMFGVLNQLNKDLKKILDDDWAEFKKDPYVMTDLYKLK